MKSVALLTSMAAAVTTVGVAQQLRGDWGEGMEEVGDAVLEHFPPEEYVVDRRILLENSNSNNSEEVDVMAERIMEEYFDEGGNDVILDEDHDYEFEPSYAGSLIEDEVTEWEYEGDLLTEDYDHSAMDVIGTVIEDEDDDGLFYWDEDEEPIVKDTAPEPDTTTLEGNHLLGGDVDEYDQYDRREASCGDNKSQISIFLKTDLYAYETKWKLVDSRGQVVASGPPARTNYADGRTYSGRWCVNPGAYRAVVYDSGKDGMCTGDPRIYGCGFFKVFKDGQIAGQVTSDKSRWAAKQFSMNVAPVQSRIDGTNTNNNNNGGWCNKVRSVMKVPQGTCTLPSGQRGHRVRVLMKVDKYGMESSWAVRRNGVVQMKQGPTVPANGQRVVEKCLPPGSYSITVSDMDGLCCKHGQGKFDVIIDGKPLISGGQFIKSKTHQFKLGYNWINTMTERDCEWWFAHDYRRRDWHTRSYSGYYSNKSYRHLKYSPQLKRNAQIYANKLLDTCNDSGIKHDATEEGENLAKNKGSGVWGQLYPAEMVVKRFVDNEEFWPWNKNAHLTQAMWYSTRYMGCADSKKDLGNGKTCRMQVCRYAKAGNCLMGKYQSSVATNWMRPMMMDDTDRKSVV